MADIGLNPPRINHARCVPGNATVTGIKFGMVVVWAGTNFRDVALPSKDGDNKVAGICVSQTDPTNGTAVGDSISICVQGVAEVLLAASTAIDVGDNLVTSSTTGQVKKLASETTPDIVGTAANKMASNASVTRIACELKLYQHA